MLDQKQNLIEKKMFNLQFWMLYRRGYIFFRLNVLYICVFMSTSKSKISSICYCKNAEKRLELCRMKITKQKQNHCYNIEMFRRQATKDHLKQWLPKAKKSMYSRIFVRLQFSFLFFFFLVISIRYMYYGMYLMVKSHEVFRIRKSRIKNSNWK